MASVAPLPSAPIWHDATSAREALCDTGGELIYAIGDIHGCYDLLRSMLALVSADAGIRARGRRPVLILLGDYVDRGPHSAQVIEAVLWLRRHAPFEVHLLRGNHEQGLLDFIDDPAANGRWLKFGAEQTFSSYGIAPPASDEPAELMRVRDDLLENMPAAHLQLLRTLEMIVDIGDYAFVHAGIRPGRSLPDQTNEDMMWIRRGFLDHSGELPRMIVHGHGWNDEHPQICTNRIGIDTGAYSTDTLTALMLDGTDASYTQVVAG